MEIIKIRRSDYVRGKLEEAIDHSNKNYEEVLLTVGADSKDKAILVGNEYWEDIFDITLNPSTYREELVDIGSRRQPENDDNPDFERLKRLINDLNGTPSEDGVVAAKSLTGAYGEYESLAQLVSVADWEALTETYQIIHDLGGSASEIINDTDFQPVDEGEFSGFLGYSSIVYEILENKRVRKQRERIKSKPQAYRKGLQVIMEELRFEPKSPSRKFEALKGDLKGYYSKRITQGDRVVYSVEESEHVVRLYDIMQHYGD